MRRAHLCRTGQKDGTDGRAACCFYAKWGKGARLNRQAPLVISWGGAKRPEGKAPARTGGRPCHSLRMAQRAGGKSARPNGRAPLVISWGGAKRLENKAPARTAGTLLFLRGRHKGPEGKASARTAGTLLFLRGRHKGPESKAPARTGRRPCHSLRMAQRTGGQGVRLNRQAPCYFLGRRKGPESKAPA